MLKKTIRKIDIFKGLSGANMSELTSWIKLIEYQGNRTIFREGYKPDGLYVLLEGEVVVMKMSSRGSFRLNTLEAPSFFGEISLLIDSKRSTGIRAVSKVKLGFLPAETFHQQLAANNETALLITANLAKLLSQRLAETNDQVETA